MNDIPDHVSLSSCVSLGVPDGIVDDALKNHRSSLRDDSCPKEWGKFRSTFSAEWYATLVVITSLKDKMTSILLASEE